MPPLARRGGGESGAILPQKLLKLKNPSPAFRLYFEEISGCFHVTNYTNNIKHFQADFNLSAHVLEDSFTPCLQARFIRAFLPGCFIENYRSLAAHQGPS